MSIRNPPEKESERAVSPVIGVILMVAITVILAAVIAAFVLDIGPTDPEPNAAVEVEGDTVELVSLDNADAVVVVDDAESDEYDSDNVLTTAGATGDVSNGENVQAVRVDDLENFEENDNEWGEVTANAIVDNLED